MRSLFKSEKAEQEYFQHYHKTLAIFEVPYTAKYVNTSYGKTHILIFGDQSKKPLLLLHGMTMSSMMWYPNVKHLIKERCVYAVDVLGDFGKSLPVKIINNNKAAADWLYEVLDGLHLNKCDLAGHSMGGFLALNFTLHYPNRVSKLILFAPAGSFDRLNPMFYIRVFPAILLHCKWLTYKAFRWLAGRGSKDILDPRFKALITLGYLGARPLLHVIPTVFSDELFLNYNNKTLLLIGDKEVIYRANKALKQARRVIPHIEAYKIDGAGHLLTGLNANIVNDYMIRFLKD